MRAALGVAGAPHADVLLPLGAHHPTSAGGLLLRVETDGDLIADAEVEVSLAHRGVERLLEVRDYRQALTFASRHHWLSGVANEVGLCQVAESLLGLTVPERAIGLRALWSELTRISHHLAFAGSWLRDAGVEGRPGAAGREAVLQLLAAATGGRIHLAACCVGGVLSDLPEDWDLAATLDVVEHDLDQLGSALQQVLPRTRGIGILRRADAVAFGVLGPVGRASGVDVDLRRDDPGASYPAVEVVTRDAGDAPTRIEVLLAEARVSVEQCRRLHSELPGGELRVRTPKTLRLPEGSAHAWTESPGGPNGWWLVSRGGPTPHRLALSTPGYATAQAVPAILRGTPAEHLVLTLGSLLLISGDLAK